MKYEYKFNFDDYVSYLKMYFKLSKGKDKIDKRVIIGCILVYICTGMCLRVIGLKLLSNLFMIIVGALSIFCSIILSNKVLSTNPKIIAKIMAKKNPDIIFANRHLEIKDSEIILHRESSSQATSGKAIKDIVMDENIIGIVSIKDTLCAYIPVSVFKDENEKEEFIKIIKDMREKDSVFDEKMDYSYKIDVDDYANYIMAYNDSVKLNKKVQVCAVIFIGIIGGYQVIRSIMQFGNYKIAIFNAIIYPLIFIVFCIIIKSDLFLKKSYSKAGKKYFKENPHFFNEQQVKIEDDGVLHHINNTTNRVNFSDIKKVVLKNDTIVVLGKMNLLLLIIPTHVFHSESERDEFIKHLNNPFN
ncbi:MAG: hypothetical protein ACRCYC_12310 [Paraclostridium sp.]|uniref:hypothetical protein n=1 Tax=Paraclostridium sp. TaxID=2023273 RepID=UPI003F334525